MTLARMNLTDVYIILAWYEYAEPNLKRGGNRNLRAYFAGELTLDEALANLKARLEEAGG